MSDGFEAYDEWKLRSPGDERSHSRRPRLCEDCDRPCAGQWCEDCAEEREEDR